MDSAETSAEIFDVYDTMGAFCWPEFWTDRLANNILLSRRCRDSMTDTDDKDEKDDKDDTDEKGEKDDTDDKDIYLVLYCKNLLSRDWMTTIKIRFCG
jgi:hypothetical protein